MRRSIALLIVALAMLWCVSSLATWAQQVTSPATLKDSQCQSVCTTKCDANGRKCLISCDDSKTGNNLRKELSCHPLWVVGSDEPARFALNPRNPAYRVTMRRRSAPCRRRAFCRALNVSEFLMPIHAEASLPTSRRERYPIGLACRASARFIAAEQQGMLPPALYGGIFGTS